MYKKFDLLSDYNNKPKHNIRRTLFELHLENIRWVHANPTMYEWSLVNNDANNCLKHYVVTDNLKENANKLYYNIVDAHSDKKFIVLKGRRGSGKSSFLNYFINTYTRRLNKKNFTWVRIDCTKIYDKAYSFGEDLGFGQYLYGQLLFVYFRYKGYPDKDNSGKIVTEIRCDNNSVNPIEIDSFDNVFAQAKKKFLDAIKDNESLMSDYQKAEIESKSAKHCSNGLYGKPFKYQKLGEALYGILRDRLVLIIDGVDNISYDSVAKDKLFDDFGLFLKRIQKLQHQPHRIMLSLRNENIITLSESIYPLNSKEADKYGNSILEIDVENFKVTFGQIISRLKAEMTIDASKDTFEINIQNLSTRILKHFQTFIKNTKHHEKHIENIKNLHDFEKPIQIEIENFQKYLDFDFENSSNESIRRVLGRDIVIIDKDFFSYLRDMDNEIFKEIKHAVAWSWNRELQSIKNSNDSQNLLHNLKNLPIKYFFEYCEVFENTIATAYNKTTQENDSSQMKKSQVLDEFFNGDMRELFVHAYKTYLQFAKLSKDIFDPKNDKNLDFKGYISKKHLSVMEFIFKNGNERFISRADILFHPPYRNINMINLMNVPDTVITNYSPLYFFYILDYLKKNRSFDNLKTEFKMHEHTSYLKSILNNFLEFGYISPTDSDDTVVYSLTNKGERILTYSIHNIVVMQSYIYTGLINEDVYDIFTKIEKSNEEFSRHFTSKLLLNLSVLYYMLDIDIGTLNSKGIKSSSFGIDFINPTIREHFKNYFEVNNYLFSDLFKITGDIEDNITPKGHIYQSKWLHKNISDFVRDKVLHPDIYKKWFENTDNRKRLRKALSRQERYAFLSIILGVASIDEILGDLDYHEFLYKEAKGAKKAKRTSELKSINYVKYYDSLKEKIKELESTK